MREPQRLLALDIDGMEPDGAGFGIVEGRRVSIDGVIPGERVEVRLARQRGGRLAGEVTRLLRGSPQRVEPGCRHFGSCGGCTWQHIAYEEQVRLKREMLQSLLAASLGGGVPRVRPVVAGQPWGFRDKVHFVFAPASRTGGLVMGHCRRHSQAVVAVEECPVHAPAGNLVAFALRDGLSGRNIPGVGADVRRGIARHVVVRVSEATGERLATLVVTRNDKALRPVVRALVAGSGAPDGFHLNIHSRPGSYLFGPTTDRIHGVQRVREEVGGVSFLISPTAFFQTNVRAAGAMLHVVLQHAGGAPRVLDLYAGAGLFALPLTHGGARVTAVEEDPEAVADGEASRRLNRIPESACRFVRARAEDVAAGRLRRVVDARPDVVILDPPRQGCPPPVLTWIAATLGPARVIYVSCNPEALAGDLRRLIASAYRLVLVQPIDMFPHTAHIESIAVLERSHRP